MRVPWLVHAAPRICDGGVFLACAGSWGVAISSARRLPIGACRRTPRGESWRGHAWACLYITGDWDEYAGPLGLASWQYALRPGYECPAYNAGQYIALGNSMGSLRWGVNAETDYDNARRRCELHVTIATDEEKTMLFGRLRPDKRDNGARGLALVSDPPPLACGVVLHADDRLEPSEGFLDYALAPEATPPFMVTFWRRSEESLSRHRNPLVWEATELTTKHSITTDTLHCFYLGVLKVWCAQVVWALLDAGDYGQVGTAEERVASAVLAVRASSLCFYKLHRQELPSEELTHLADLTTNIIGTRASTQLKTKGANTWGSPSSPCGSFRRHQARLPTDGTRLLRAGENLERAARILTRDRATWPRVTKRTVESSSQQSIIHKQYHGKRDGARVGAGRTRWRSGTSTWRLWFRSAALCPHIKGCATCSSTPSSTGTPTHYATWADDRAKQDAEGCMQACEPIVLRARRLAPCAVFVGGGEQSLKRGR